ncbi:MAG: FAD-binding domain-containing protein [Methylobacter sp.]
MYRWLPELQAFPPLTLHHWDKQHSTCDYPAPIIDHSRESRVAKARFKEVIAM